jgi:A/G-specific adenine glycosylase
VALRPTRTAKPGRPYYDVVAAVVQSADHKVLIIRRPAQGLLGGLWGFPGGTVEPDEDLPDAICRTVLQQTGLSVSARAVIRTVKHAYTHFRITLHAFTAEIDAGDARALTCAEVRWVEVDELGSYALPVTDRKVAEAFSAR